LKPRVWRVACLLLTFTGMYGCNSEKPYTPPASSAAPVPAAQQPVDTAASPNPPASPTHAESPVSPPRDEAPVIVTQSDSDLGLSEEDTSAEVVAPEVLLSSDHQATCRVQVGDTFPDLSLTALDGQPTPLESQLGKRLTVVVFWNRRQPMSIEQLRQLQTEFVVRYRQAGVSVVTINVGDSPETIRDLHDETSGEYVWLRDPDGQAFAQIATELLPRTYLLRPDRQVVWLDLEYSRSTRRELRNAILYVLKQFEQQASNGNPSRT
jgi:peroxiredoxin